MKSRRSIAFGLCALSLLCDAAQAGSRPKRGAPSAYVLQSHLDRAMAVDTQRAWLLGQRAASAARHATADSLTPGSPYVAGSARGTGAGSYANYADPADPNRNRMRELELEAGLPLWLPGQRSATRDVATTGVVEADEKLALRRLELAGQLRESWWTARRAAREAQIASERRSTTLEISHDVTRRSELGDASNQDALLARNELLAADADLSQATASARAARLAYATLTDRAEPDGVLEPAAPASGASVHPAVRAARATLDRAEAQARLTDASFMENPELGIFGRRETNWQGATRADATTLGVRFRMSLPTEGRNAPRRAEAAAEVARVAAEYGRVIRLVAMEVSAARFALEAARRTDAIAAQRLSVANKQLDLAREAYRLGEINAFDLFRIRQTQVEALRGRANAEVDLGLANSRLRQALGFSPPAGERKG